MKYPKRYNKKKYKRKGNTLKQKVTKLSNFVYKTIERKQVTTRSDIADPATNNISDGLWNFTELTKMDINPTGARNNNRIGNDITMSSIKFNFGIEDWQPTYEGRMIIVQYPNKLTAPSGNDPQLFLEYGDVDAGAVPPILEGHVIQSLYRPGSTCKYRILKDIKIRLRHGQLKGSLLFINTTITKKDGMKEVLSFNAEDPTSLSAFKNNIFAYWRFTDGNTNIGPATRLEMQYQHRMTYRDS